MVGQLGHPLLVGTAHHQRAAPHLEDLLDRHDLAGDLRRSHHDHVVRLVQHHFRATTQVVRLDVGRHLHPHFSAAGRDVHRAIGVGGQQRGVAGGRPGQLVHLVPQSGDVIPGLSQGERELLVLRDRLSQLGLQLRQAVFKRADALGRLGSAPGHHGVLALGRRQPVVKLLGLSGKSLGFVAGRHRPPPDARPQPTRTGIEAGPPLRRDERH